MRISDQDYFRSCVAKERHLARLLGHTHIEEDYESAGTLWENTNALPKWTRDWKACGPLMTQYDIEIAYGKEQGIEISSFATIGSTGGCKNFCVNGPLAGNCCTSKELLKNDRHKRTDRQPAG